VEDDRAKEASSHWQAEKVKAQEVHARAEAQAQDAELVDQVFLSIDSLHRILKTRLLLATQRLGRRTLDRSNALWKRVEARNLQNRQGLESVHFEVRSR